MHRLYGGCTQSLLFWSSMQCSQKLFIWVHYINWQHTYLKVFSDFKYATLYISHSVPKQWHFNPCGNIYDVTYFIISHCNGWIFPDSRSFRRYQGDIWSTVLVHYVKALTEPVFCHKPSPKWPESNTAAVSKGPCWKFKYLKLELNACCDTVSVRIPLLTQPEKVIIDVC